jgi:ABC-type glycerol-3-phosphate transport system substrate-binding protein
MNPKQSVSVLLMLGLLAPMTACGGTTDGKKESESSPATTVTSPAASPKADSDKEYKDKSGKDQKSKEGGEGGES